MAAVTRYVLKQRLAGRERYPLVLMLEPLFRCNLSCTGCGKIQYPVQILKKNLSVEDCVRASGRVRRAARQHRGRGAAPPPPDRRHRERAHGPEAVRLSLHECTPAGKKAGRVPAQQVLQLQRPHGRPQAEHDASVCREGVYDEAVGAIRAALARGFRVTTNTTLFEGADPQRMRGFFDDMMALGVEGMMISPGYSYQKAPDQEHFLHRERSHRLFSRMLESPKRSWRFKPVAALPQFLMGKRDFECTPWGNPTFNVFGWQRPCYLLQDGYAKSFRELMEETDWSQYGRKSGNPKCQDCMVHCGFEPTAVKATFESRGRWAPPSPPW